MTFNNYILTISRTWHFQDGDTFYPAVSGFTKSLLALVMASSLTHNFLNSQVLYFGGQNKFSPAPMGKYSWMSLKQIIKFIFYNCCVSHSPCSQDAGILVITHIQKKTAEAWALS